MSQTLKVSATVDGVNYESSRVVDEDGVLELTPAIPAGNPGTLGTRTDDNTGIATLSAGHGIESADKVDVYWSAGCRYGMTATVDGVSVSVDGGAGANLPLAETVIVVSKQIEFACEVSGAAVAFVYAYADQKCHFGFLAAQDASVSQWTLRHNGVLPWDEDWEYANPLGSSVVEKLVVSNGSTTAGTFYLQIQFDPAL